jgi:hypothetical protein
VFFVVLLHVAVWWTRLIPGRCVVVLSDFFSFTSFWQRTLIWSQLIFYGNFINSRARDRLIEYFIRVEGKCTGCKSEDRLFGKAVDPVNCHPSQSLGLNELHHYLRKRILQDESFLCACPPPSKKEFLDTLMEVYSGPGCNVIDGILTCYFPVHNPLLDATSHQCWKYIWTWSWLLTGCPSEETVFDTSVEMAFNLNGSTDKTSEPLRWSLLCLCLRTTWHTVIMKTYVTHSFESFPRQAWPRF